jgi:hypothetical protein
MSKSIKANRFGAMGAQVGVQESSVTQLIIGIIANILGHVAIEILECKFVGGISDIGWAVVGFCRSSQLIVLDPQIAFYDFGPGRESEKVRIAFGKSSSTLFLRFSFAHQYCTGWQQRCANNAQASEK